MIEEGPLPGWGGGSFRVQNSVIGWDVRNDLFWVHSFSCPKTEVENAAAAKLVQAVRRKCRSMGYHKMFWQVFPDLTGTAMLKTLAKRRAKIDYIQMYLNV